MFVTIVLVILALFALLGLAVAIINPDVDGGDTRGFGAGFFVVFLIIFLVVGGITSITAVDARSYGVITAAGKYERTVDSGITTHAPWAKVEEFSTTNKTVELGRGGQPLKINFANGGSADVKGKVTYRIKDKKGIESLWKEYLTPNKVEDALVEPAANSTARTDISKYAPFDALKGTSQNQMETDIKTTLNEQLNQRGLDVRSVEIYYLQVDTETQKRINAEAQAKADYNTKLQQKRNAEVDAQKDAVRRGNSSAQDRCLELLRSWSVAANGPIPLTMNCGLGSPANVATGVK